MPFDWFTDTAPEVIERVKQAEKRGKARGWAIGKAEGFARGKAKGELQTLRWVITQIIQHRFPDLADFAKVQANKLTQPDALRKLVLDIMQAPDEITTIRLLTGK